MQLPASSTNKRVQRHSVSKQLHLSVAIENDLRNFFVQYLSQSNLSFASFVKLWKDFGMPLIHLACPNRMEYPTFIQIIFSTLMGMDRCYINNAQCCERLGNLPCNQSRLLVCKVAEIYALYSIYFTQLEGKIHDSRTPIRCTSIQLDDLINLSNALKESLGAVGQSIYQMITYLIQSQAISSDSSYPGPIWLHSIKNSEGSSSSRVLEVAELSRWWCALDNDAKDSIRDQISSVYSLSSQSSNTGLVEEEGGMGGANSSSSPSTMSLSQKLAQRVKETVERIMQRRRERAAEISQSRAQQKLLLEKQRARMLKKVYTTRKTGPKSSSAVALAERAVNNASPRPGVTGSGDVRDLFNDSDSEDASVHIHEQIPAVGSSGATFDTSGNDGLSVIDYSAIESDPQGFWSDLREFMTATAVSSTTAKTSAATTVSAASAATSIPQNKYVAPYKGIPAASKSSSAPSGSVAGMDQLFRLLDQLEGQVLTVLEMEQDHQIADQGIGRDQQECDGVVSLASQQEGKASTAKRKRTQAAAVRGDARGATALPSKVSRLRHSDAGSSLEPQREEGAAGGGGEKHSMEQSAAHSGLTSIEDVLRDLEAASSLILSNSS